MTLGVLFLMRKRMNGSICVLVDVTIIPPKNFVQKMETCIGQIIMWYAMGIRKLRRVMMYAVWMEILSEGAGKFIW